VIRALIADERQRSHALRHSELLSLDLAHGKNAEPVVARQFEQWQINATTTRPDLILDGMATAAPLQHGDSLRLLANHQARLPDTG